MLLQSSATLENVIVGLLSRSKSGLGAAEIRTLVASELRPYSRRGIYKELLRLESEGIITRSGGRYMLRLAWLLTLRSEVEAMLEHASDPELLRDLLPGREHEILVRCSDLVRWDRIWTQLMLMLHAAYPRLPMFIWCPRHWFSLTHPKLESTFVRANEMRKSSRYCIVGGRGPLDRRDAPLLARKSTAYSFRLSPFEHDRTHYYWVIGDFVGSSVLDSRTADAIDRVYEETTRLSDLPPDAGRRLLAHKIRGTVRCTWAPQRAEKLRKVFVKFFDLTLSETGEPKEIRRGER